MKILFALGNVYPHDDANSSIIMRICRELQNIEPEIEIYLLGLGNSDGSEVFNGIQITQFSISDLINISNGLEAFLQKNRANSRKRRFMQLIFSPQFLFEYIQARIKSPSPSMQYRDRILTLHHQHHFDAIIGVSFPFVACLGAAQARLNVPFIYYQLDPYFSHYQQSNKRLSIKQENYVCQRANTIILTEQIYNDYLQSPLKKSLSKAVVLGFPAIEKASYTGTSHSPDRNSKRGIRMLYLGSLYYDIRSPRIFLKLVYEMLKNGFEVAVDIVGPVFGSPDEDTRNYLDLLRNHIVFHGRVNKDVVKAWIDKADVLINIGNRIENQLPSKIFEYFSTGKPILNFYQLRRCPTLKYTNQYPACMNISEVQVFTKEYLIAVHDFCVKNMRHILSYETIEKIFRDFTCREVGKKFYDLLKSAVLSSSNMSSGKRGKNE